MSLEPCFLRFLKFETAIHRTLSTHAFQNIVVELVSFFPKHLYEYLKSFFSLPCKSQTVLCMQNDQVFITKALTSKSKKLLNNNNNKRVKLYVLEQQLRKLKLGNIGNKPLSFNCFVPKFVKIFG